MIVSEAAVETALKYLNDDPHPLALARKDLTDDENEAERIYAELYRSLNTGSVRERECFVEASALYREAKAREAEAQFQYERHRARIRAADMVIEIWRTENANARAAERVR